MSVQTEDKLVSLSGLKYALENYAPLMGDKATEIYINSSTWSNVYEELSKIPLNTTGTVAISATGAGSITNNAIGNSMRGIANHFNTTTFDFICLVNATSPYLVTFSLTSVTSSTHTVSNLKKYFGSSNSPSLLVNLESTTAADVIQDSPRPGVTGTLPIGSGGTGAITAAGARTNLNTGLNIILDTNTWPAVYSEVSKLEIGETGVVGIADADTASLLTDGKRSSTLFGFIFRSADKNYDFWCTAPNSNYAFAWRDTFSNDNTTATVGSVYRYSGTAI